MSYSIIPKRLFDAQQKKNRAVLERQKKADEARMEKKKRADKYKKEQAKRRQQSVKASKGYSIMFKK